MLFWCRRKYMFLLKVPISKACTAVLPPVGVCWALIFQRSRVTYRHPLCSEPFRIVTDIHCHERRPLCAEFIAKHMHVFFFCEFWLVPSALCFIVKKMTWYFDGHNNDRYSAMFCPIAMRVICWWCRTSPKCAQALFLYPFSYGFSRIQRIQLPMRRSNELSRLFLMFTRYATKSTVIVTYDGWLADGPVFHHS